jgi:hypothetical protein
MRNNPILTKTPPKDIPVELLDRYTMNGKIRIRHWYINDAYPPEKPIIYSREKIDAYISKIKKREVFACNRADAWFYRALGKYSIKEKNVAIFGSVLPGYESLCLSYGGIPTTIEYNRIIAEDPRLKIITPGEYDKNPIKFDAAFSISSFEHDGLGRYGDPLNPEGDLDAMSKAKFMIKKNGLLFLSVPIGIDTLVWNAHRIYGKIRLSKLLNGWKVLNIFGWEALLFNADFGVQHGAQPVFVLQNNDPGRATMSYIHGLDKRIVFWTLINDVIAQKQIRKFLRKLRNILANFTYFIGRYK